MAGTRGFGEDAVAPEEVVDEERGVLPRRGRVGMVGEEVVVGCVVGVCVDIFRGLVFLF